MRNSTIKRFPGLGSGFLLSAVAGFLIIGDAAFAAEPQMVKSHAPTREALVVVNHDTIFTTDLDAALVQFHTGMDEKKRADFDYHKLLNKLVNDRLLSQEARNLGVDKEDWFVKQLGGLRRQAAIRRFVTTTFKPNLAISDSAILAYFQVNYSKLQVRTVSVKTSAEAQALREKIVKGAAMDSIAKKVSLDISRFQGGLRGAAYRGDMETILRDQASKLKPGQLSQPFPYREVFTVLRLERTEPADTAELAGFKSKITGILKEQKRQAAWKSFIAGLAAKYPVTVDSVALRKLQNDSTRLFTQNFVKGTQSALFRVDAAHQVTDEEFRTIMSRAAMSAGNQPFDSIRSAAAVRAREDIMLSAAADKAGYENDSAVTAFYDKAVDSALVEAYLKETIIPQIKFNHAEFEAYYNKNLDHFREPEQILMDRVIIPDSAVAAEAESRLAGGADFGFVAKQFSKDIKMANADEPNEWALMAAFPQSIADEIGKIAIGKSTRAFLTTDGWVIFRVKARRQGKVKELAEVEMEIRGIMFQKKFDAALDKTMTTIKGNAVIEYKDKAIARYFGTE